MCNNFPNIRITEGNNFSIILPLRSRTYVATRPIDEDIDPALLQNIVVTFGGVEYPAQITEGGVQIDLPATLAVGTYNILLTAEYLESSIRAAYESAVTIVPWSAQSTAEQYITGSPIVMRAAYVLSCVLTDAELEALKEEYREKIAEAEQAKEEAEEAKAEWEQKAAELDGVAQEATLTQGVQNIRADISHIDIDTTTLAKEVQVKDGNDSAISVGKEVRSELGTGSDTAAETGTLFAIVKWVKDKVNAITGYALQGSDATATNTAIKQAILDNAGVPTLTIPSTTASQELAPNTLYVFASRSAALTLTLGTPITGIANEYHFFLICDDTTAPTVTWPSGITWNGGSAPTIAAAKTYEVSILNDVAAYFETDNPEEESES